MSGDIVPEIRPMRPWHVPQAAWSSYCAFKPLAFQVYLRTEHDQGAWWRRTARAFLTLLSEYLIIIFAMLNDREVALQIDGGIAGGLHKRGGDAPPPPTPVADFIWKWLGATRRTLNTAEQNLRSLEIRTKNDAAVKVALGDADVWRLDYLESVWTDPAAQRRGYGSAIVKAICDEADKAGQKMWLQAPDVNVTFYAAAGFVVEAQFTLGDGNPRWEHKPVGMVVMIREPQGKKEGVRTS
ncbi:hypothetical protein PENSPDRAFT_167437 [Peniophora sp. CONT]|nr:hypothetical protein PENSPDRAFT_167437 [Peniophora sp. CONT]